MRLEYLLPLSVVIVAQPYIFYKWFRYWKNNNSWRWFIVLVGFYLSLDILVLLFGGLYIVMEKSGDDRWMYPIAFFNVFSPLLLILLITFIVTGTILMIKTIFWLANKVNTKAKGSSILSNTLPGSNNFWFLLTFITLLMIFYLGVRWLFLV